jgi:hypothetical protein
MKNDTDRHEEPILTVAELDNKREAKNPRAEVKQKHPARPEASPSRNKRSPETREHAAVGDQSPTPSGLDNREQAIGGPKLPPGWPYPWIGKLCGGEPPSWESANPLYNGASPMHTYDYRSRYMMVPPSSMAGQHPMAMGGMGPPSPYGPGPMSSIDAYAMHQYMAAMHQHGMYYGGYGRGY